MSTSTKKIFKEKFIIRRPLATNDFAEGLRRVSPEEGLKKKHLQVSLSSYSTMLTFDIDDSESSSKIKTLAFDDEVIPEPAWITTNPFSGHSHVGYILKDPVGTAKGLKFVEDTRRRLTAALGADQAYSALVTRNPLVGATEWLEPHLYTLKELNERLAKDIKLPKLSKSSTEILGRNDAIFKALREHAYSEYRRLKWDDLILREELEKKAFSLYYSLDDPSGFTVSELGQIVSSVVKWVTKKFSQEEFSKIQAARSQKRWGDNAAKKEIIKIMRELGHSWGEIAEEVESTPRAVAAMYKRI